MTFKIYAEAQCEIPRIKTKYMHLNLGKTMIIAIFHHTHTQTFNVSITLWYANIDIENRITTQYKYMFFYLSVLFLILVGILFLFFLLNVSGISSSVLFMEQLLTVVAALNDNVICKTTSWCWIGGLGNSSSPIQLLPSYLYWNKFGHGLDGKS